MNHLLKLSRPAVFRDKNYNKICKHRCSCCLLFTTRLCKVSFSVKHEFFFFGLCNKQKLMCSLSLTHTQGQRQFIFSWYCFLLEHRCRMNSNSTLPCMHVYSEMSHMGEVDEVFIYQSQVARAISEETRYCRNSCKMQFAHHQLMLKLTAWHLQCLLVMSEIKGYHLVPFPNT